MVFITLYETRIFLNQIIIKGIIKGIPIFRGHIENKVYFFSVHLMYCAVHFFQCIKRFFYHMFNMSELGNYGKRLLYFYSKIFFLFFYRFESKVYIF